MFNITALKNDGLDKGPSPTSGIYLDGKLEDLNGFDLVHIEQELPTVNGVFDCEVTINEITYSAKFFFWRSEVTGPRGLISEVDDTDSLEASQEKFNARAAFI